MNDGLIEQALQPLLMRAYRQLEAGALSEDGVDGEECLAIMEALTPLLSAEDQATLAEEERKRESAPES